MDTSDSFILTSLEDTVLRISLNRPDKANALTLAMIADLRKAFQRAESDAAVRCVLLAANGSAFSAGHDITEMQIAAEASYREHLLRTYNPLILQIRRLEKPVLAAVNGVASGAAVGICLACDLRLAADSAQFVVGFAGIGLATDSAVSLFLPMLIGLGRASEHIFTNAPITAQQGLNLGLFNRVVPAAELLVEAQRWAASLAAGPVRTLGLIKRALNKAMLANLEEVLDYEAHIQEIARQSAEHQEGVRAFLDKRLPDFRAHP